MSSTGDSSFWIGPLCGGTIGAVLVLAVFFVLSQRKARDAVGAKPQGLPYFLTQTPPLNVVQVVVDAAARNGYKVEDVDHSVGRVILSTPATLLSWGYFFTVYITSPDGRQSWVEVEAKARVPQWGPLAQRRNNREAQKCLNMLQALFLRAT